MSRDVYENRAGAAGPISRRQAPSRSSTSSYPFASLRSRSFCRQVDIGGLPYRVSKSIELLATQVPRDAQASTRWLIRFADETCGLVALAKAVHMFALGTRITREPPPQILFVRF